MYFLINNENGQVKAGRCPKSLCVQALELEQVVIRKHQDPVKLAYEIFGYGVVSIASLSSMLRKIEVGTCKERAEIAHKCRIAVDQYYESLQSCS